MKTLPLLILILWPYAPQIFAEPDPAPVQKLSPEELKALLVQPTEDQKCGIQKDQEKAAKEAAERAKEIELAKAGAAALIADPKNVFVVIRHVGKTSNSTTPLVNKCVYIGDDETRVLKNHFFALARLEDHPDQKKLTLHFIPLELLSPELQEFFKKDMLFNWNRATEYGDPLYKDGDTMEFLKLDEIPQKDRDYYLSIEWKKLARKDANGKVYPPEGKIEKKYISLRQEVYGFSKFERSSNGRMTAKVVRFGFGVDRGIDYNDSEGGLIQTAVKEGKASLTLDYGWDPADNDPRRDD